MLERGWVYKEEVLYPWEWGREIPGCVSIVTGENELFTIEPNH
jgi:hypothetical protein